MGQVLALFAHLGEPVQLALGGRAVLAGLLHGLAHGRAFVLVVVQFPLVAGRPGARGGRLVGTLVLERDRRLPDSRVGPEGFRRALMVQSKDFMGTTAVFLAD